MRLNIFLILNDYISIIYNHFHIDPLDLISQQKYANQLLLKLNKYLHINLIT